MNLVIFVIGIFSVVYLYLRWIHTYWNRMGFKTLPNYNYLFGHFKGVFFDKMNIADFLQKLHNSTTEPFIGIYAMFRPTLLIRDPELIRSVLIKDFTHFTDRGIFCNEDYDPLSAHLFALPGQKWKNLRTKLTPTFTSGKLKAMFSTIVNCGKTMQDHLDKFANSEEVLDVCETSASYTTNVIASVAFGIEIDAISDPNTEFRVIGRQVLKPTIYNIMKLLFFFFQPKFLNFFRIKAVDKGVEKFLTSMVKQNLEYREKNNVIRKDFFQLLIQLRNSNAVQSDGDWNTTIVADESKKMMSVNEIAAQTYVFFVAGFETSATTLSYCLFELAKNPEVQQRAHDEIDQVLDQHNDEVTYESIFDMKYLDACIDETLRKYPAVPLLNRTCVKEYKIPGTKHVIPKGVELYIPIYALHRDEKYFEDPEKFEPERFSAENSEGKNLLNRPYLPFGDGPRNCIGMRLGKLQTKTGLVMMLKKFRFGLKDQLNDKDLPNDPELFFLGPLGGIKLQVYKR